jgi:hypothetical protein
MTGWDEAGEKEKGRAERTDACGAKGRAEYGTLRSSSTMRGALTEATLPVVIRRTCVCPSRLLVAAVKCLVMQYRMLDVGSGGVGVGGTCENTRIFRTGHYVL